MAVTVITEIDVGLELGLGGVEALGAVVVHVLVAEGDEQAAAGPVVQAGGAVAVVDVAQAAARVTRQLRREHQQERALVELVASLHQVLEPALPVLRHDGRPREGMRELDVCRPPRRLPDVARGVAAPRAGHHERDEPLQLGRGRRRQPCRVAVGEEQRQVRDHGARGRRRSSKFRGRRLRCRGTRNHRNG